MKNNKAHSKLITLIIGIILIAATLYLITKGIYAPIFIVVLAIELLVFVVFPVLHFIKDFHINK